MTPYKSNSALYLDYLATVRTREQIEADPRLCVFLNNPYIKDNMEIALLYNAAKTGDYVDKCHSLNILCVMVQNWMLIQFYIIVLK